MGRQIFGAARSWEKLEDTESDEDQTQCEAHQGHAVPGAQGDQPEFQHVQAQGEIGGGAGLRARWAMLIGTSTETTPLGVRTIKLCTEEYLL